MGFLKELASKSTKALKAAGRGLSKAGRWVVGRSGKEVEAAEKGAAKSNKIAAERLIREAESGKKAGKGASEEASKASETTKGKNRNRHNNSGGRNEGGRNHGNQSEGNTEGGKKNRHRNRHRGNRNENNPKEGESRNVRDEGNSEGGKKNRHRNKNGQNEGSEGGRKGNNKEQNVRNGEEMPDEKKQSSKHEFAKEMARKSGHAMKELTFKSGHAMKEITMKHPWMPFLMAGGGGLALSQFLNGADDGLGVLQRLQAFLVGGQYKDGNLVGAKGIFPTATAVYTGTEEQQRGDNFYDSTTKGVLGERRAKKVNLALDRLSNEGWYIVGQGNKLIDATGHVCGEIHDGTKDLLGKVVNGTGEVIGEMRDGKVMTYGNDDGVSEGGESQDGNYMGNSGQTPTRAQQLSQAMGPAELAGGIVATMMTRSWPIRILGGLTAFNGYQNIRQHSQQMQNSVNQGYSQGGGQQPSVTYQPSDEVVVNTGRGV